jgi:cyclopropane-fatty-acyl-phospholipid synthase
MPNTALNLQQAEYPEALAKTAIDGAESAVRELLRGVTGGTLRLIDPYGAESTFGSAGPIPEVTLRVLHPEFFARVLSGGSLALGESYCDGWWDVDDARLVDLFRILFKGRVEQTVRLSSGTKLRILLRSLTSDSRYRSAARNNIAAHYDLGNEFFEQMLGDSMTYSCGYMHHPDDSIDDLQQQKYARILKKLAPQPGGNLLDIGCGWGSLLIYAAKSIPELKGVGVTLSVEQQRFAQRRIQKEGLTDRLQIELRDYRDLSGTFDRVVSVGMFEHVGRASYPEYMRTFHNLLSPDGVGLLHTIGSEEDPRIQQDPWLAKYIFPGSVLPRLEWIVSEARKAELAIGHVENWRPHYAATLQRWRDRFVAKWDGISQLGEQFDERFFRLWNYYLQLCEACFIDSTIELYQLLLSRRERWSFPERFEF